MAMNVSFLRGLSTSFKAEGFSPVSTTFYFLTDTNELYLGSVLLSNEITAAQFEALVARVKALEDAGFQGQIDAIREELKNFGTSDTITALDNRVVALEEWKAGLPEYVEKTVYDAHLTTQSEKDAAQDKALTDYKAEMVEALAGKETAGAAAQALADAKEYSDGKLAAVVEQYLTGEGAADTIDTLNEIAEWLNSDTAGVSQIIKDVAANTANINTVSGDLDKVEAKLNGIADGDGTVKAAIDAAKEAAVSEAGTAADSKISAAIAAENLSQYAKTADVTSAIATAKGEAIADADAKLANKLDTSVHTAYVEAHKDDYANAKIDELVADAKKAGTDANAAAGAVAERVTTLEGRMPEAGKTIATTDDVATATTDMATKTHVADNYVAKEGYVAFTSEEKTKLASLENYDDTELAGRVGTIEAKPAMGITAEQITAWDNEVGAKELAGQKATLAEVKNAYIGETTAKLVDVVKAVNMLAEGSEATDKVVESVATNVKDIEAQLTWGTF